MRRWSGWLIAAPIGLAVGMMVGGAVWPDRWVIRLGNLAEWVQAAAVVVAIVSLRHQMREAARDRKAEGERRLAAIEDARQRDLTARRVTARLVKVKAAHGNAETDADGVKVWRIHLDVTNGSGRRLDDVVASLLPPGERKDAAPVGQMPLDHLRDDRLGCDIVGSADEHGRMPQFEASVEFDLDGCRWKAWSWGADVDLVRGPEHQAGVW